MASIISPLSIKKHVGYDPSIRSLVDDEAIEWGRSCLMSSKVGILGQNDIWVLGPVAKHRVYYKREGGSFPKSRPWWVLWIHVCLWFVHAPKCCNYALTNLLFGLCRSMWVSEMLVNLPSPISELQHALLPPKCCEPRSAPQLLIIPLFSLQIHIWVYQGV